MVYAVVDKRTAKQRAMQRKQALWNERQGNGWDAHWIAIQRNFKPRAGRFLGEQHNDGTPKHHEILDNTGLLAVRVLQNGMMTHSTNQVRPWFRLRCADEDLNKRHEVKAWLDDTTKRILTALASSNTYQTLHQLYGGIATFGTFATLIDRHYDRVLHHTPLAIGQYAIARDHEQRPVTLYREFKMTVAQMIGQFGPDAVSSKVRREYEQGNLDTWVDVVHCVEPREDRKPGRLDGKNKRWRSIYFEPHASGDEGMLQEGGFDRFPALVSCWDLEVGDAYGHSPAMEALGDSRSLQAATSRLNTIVHKMTDPPTQGPRGLKNIDVLRGAGEHTELAGAGKIEPLHDIDLKPDAIARYVIVPMQTRIDSAFYKDLFLLQSRDERSNVTAREVDERHEEKLIVLGPVAERQREDVQEPLVTQVFEWMLQAGALLPPPAALLGQPLEVKYVSLLAQAQQALGLSSADRWITTIGALAQLNPDVRDVVDYDAIATAYADRLGMDPDWIVPGPRVALIRKARNEAMRAKEQTANLQAHADAGASMANVPPEAMQAMLAGADQRGAA